MTEKTMLHRWVSLQQGDGLNRARSFVRLLRIAGLVMCVVVVLGGVYAWPSWAIAAIAAAIGWTIGEANALHSRVAQWPIFEQYIDWNRVRAAITNPATGPPGAI